jgi:hypothetical protein
MGQAPQEKGVEATRRRNPSLPLGESVLDSVTVPGCRGRMRRPTGGAAAVWPKICAAVCW